MIRIALGSLLLSACAQIDSSADHTEGELRQVAQSLRGGDDIEIRRIRHNDGWLNAGSSLTDPEFQPWVDNNVTKDHQKDTVIATVSEPAVADVRNLVLIVAGQQRKNGAFSDLTGQSSGYEKGWKRSDPDRDVNISLANILSTKVLRDPSDSSDSGVFDESETYSALVYDAAFPWWIAILEGSQTVKAYYEWLSSKAKRENLDAVYLVGHSRGGCLVMRLAQHFQANMPEVPVIVQSADGVCNHNFSEFGTKYENIQNPTRPNRDKPDYFGHVTNLHSKYPNKQNLSIFHLASGDPVAKVARTFANTDSFEEYQDIGWYRQRWFDRTHNGIDNEQNVMMSHLRASLKRYDCPDGKRYNGSQCVSPDCSLPGSHYDGAHCKVPTPAGHEPFIHDGSFYWDSAPGTECPLGEFDNANCLVAESEHSPFIWNNGLYTKPQGGCTLGEYDGANCLVTAVPGGSSPFYAYGNLYYTPQSGDSCPTEGAHFDGANCFAGTVPAGASPFYASGNWYVTPTGATDCPLAGSSYDGANCFHGAIPDGHNGFFYHGNLYIDPEPYCPEGSVWDTRNCFIGTPPVAGFEWNNALYYKATYSSEVELPEKTDSSDRYVRIRHEVTNRCLQHTRLNKDSQYSVDCKSNQMDQVYRLRDSTNGTRILPLSDVVNGTNRCLRANSTDGERITEGYCGNSASDFELVSLGGDRYRLRHIAHNQCFYSSNYQGGAVSSWTCWNDPNMVYTIESVEPPEEVIAPVMTPLDFSVFALQDINGPKDFRGPIAALGDISLSATSVNTESNHALGMVAGGDINLANGQTDGDLVYGGNLDIYTPSGFAPTWGISGSISTDVTSVIDLNANAHEIEALADELWVLTPTGSTNLSWGNLELEGTEPTLNIFDVDSSQLNPAWGFFIDAPAGSTVVINVHGTSLDVGGGVMSLQGVSSDHVIWNFHDATTLSVHGTEFQGSALAPRASADVSSGSFVGSLVANTVTGSGSAFLWSPFAGQLPE